MQDPSPAPGPFGPDGLIGLRDQAREARAHLVVGALDEDPAAVEHDEVRGAPITSLWLPFIVLTAMAVVVFTGATLRFRRDLAPGRTASPAGEEPAGAEPAAAGGNASTVGTA